MKKKALFGLQVIGLGLLFVVLYLAVGSACVLLNGGVGTCLGHM